MHILVTGGTGFIGSHTCVSLIEAGHDVTIIDDLSNSSREALDCVEKIAGKRPSFFEGDVRDRELLCKIFAQRPVDSVIHFAGLKAVGESVAQPLRYYDCNVGGAIVLCEEMAAAGVKSIIFSSSATVYGDPQTLPINENAPLHATNPYGRTKLHIEEILRDLAAADPRWQIVILRYFNPVGAHPSGLIGEDPRGIPNNLMPYVAQVAVGKRQHLNVFGNDYSTPDGTGVRDYIHVCDLAEGHVAALRYLAGQRQSLTVNLGTGQGYSVLDLARAYGKAADREIPLVFAPRRPGDVDACYADPQHALETMGWKASRGLEQMCVDSWRWQSTNPNGFEG